MKQVCTENKKDKMYTPYKVLKLIAIKGILSKIGLMIELFIYVDFRTTLPGLI